MTKTLWIIGASAALMGVAACSNPPADHGAGAEAVHEEGLEAKLLADYLARINSNDVDLLMEGLTDDVVYQAPHQPEVVGKAAVREWVDGYMSAYSTIWEKTSLDFVLAGDWAIERYAYKSKDTDRATGETYDDVGKGLNVYHRGDDGQWRVARDAWSTDLPVAGAESNSDVVALVENVYAGFAEGDMAKVTGGMAPDIVWNEAEGNPYADKNPYVGPDAILGGLFARLGGDWDGFTAAPQSIVADGGKVVVFGRYSGTYKATGKTMNTPFVHEWTVENGRIAAFQQYTDTAAQQAAMSQ